MTADAPNNDDWLSSPAPAPKAVDGHPNAMQPEDKKPAPQKKAPAKRAGKADMAAELKSAPVACEPAPKSAQDNPDDDPGPSSADRDAGDGPKQPGGPKGRQRGEIWDGSPVKALGVNGDYCYFLDISGQLRQAKKLEAQTIVSLFGRDALLCPRFPQFDKSGDVRKGVFNAQKAAFRMIEAATEKGLFNPDGAVRGVGAWSDDEGNLIYHTGRELILKDTRRDPGEIDGKIYPAYPPIPDPHPVIVNAKKAVDAAEETYALLSTWNWSRPEIDPMLALGMLGVQMMGGALAWRPAFWFTGDKASGKSTLQDLIRWLHGDKGLIQSNDPTKSGITARLGHSSLPVALDELEPGDEGSNKERDIIVLARVASSGGQWLRGTADQKGASGNVYSTFMFSSILIPGAMKAADRSRLITFDLNPPKKGSAKPVIDPRTQKARGATLKRVLIDRWPTWAERLGLWRVAMAEFGLDGRDGDNWATTMAMADMLMHEELPAKDHLAEWARKIAFGAKAQVDDIGSNAEDMLTHLLGQPFDVYRRGEMWNVYHWLAVAGQLPAAPEALIAGSDGAIIDDQRRQDAARTANEKLSKLGLRVKGAGDQAALFIPNKPIPGLKKLFEHSDWKDGVWVQAARRVPGAEPVEQPLSLSGTRSRGVYIPFRSISGLLSFPMDRGEAEPAPKRPDDWEEFL